MSNTPMVIYAISNPITNKVVYVGQTKNLPQRMKGHRSPGHNSDLRKEMRSIVEAGLDPVFSILEECDLSNSNEREQFWIKKHRNEGYILLNGQQGAKKLETPKLTKVLKVHPELAEAIEKQAALSGLNFQQYTIHLLAKSLQ